MAYQTLLEKRGFDNQTEIAVAQISSPEYGLLSCPLSANNKTFREIGTGE